MSQIKRHSYKIIGLIAVVMGVSWLVSAYAGGIQDKLINFQGFLTDSANSPLEGPYAITFRIYENAGDQTPIWAEYHSSVTVIKGNASVLLGSINSMDLAFDQPRYLGIQIGSDPEMTPRQKLVPSFHSNASNKLVVTYVNGAKDEFDTRMIVPIGLVSTYYGDPADLPANWKVCDGSVVNDPESPLNGHSLPDMSGRFVRGIAAGQTVSQVGGQDSDTWSIANHLHSASMASNGQHNHGGSTLTAGYHAHDILCITGSARPTSPYSGVYVQGSSWQYFSDSPGWERVQTSSGSAGSHNHTINSDGGHVHTITVNPAGEASGVINTVPSYVALHYIIRIK